MHIGMALPKPRIKIKELTKATIRCIPLRYQNRRQGSAF